MNKLNLLLFSVILTNLFFMYCSTQTAEKNSAPSILIEAENFLESSESIQVVSCIEGGEQVNSLAAKQWLSFEVNVPVAGRYKCQIRASASSNENSILWVEDYIDNPDGRTYNITSSMMVPAASGDEEFTTIEKDGSPLNAGLHKMKLHLENQQIAVNWIKFILIKEHQETPEVLTQSTTGEQWKLMWSDEFNGSGLPDTSKWTYDIGNWGWGNNEPQYYTEFRTQNARQEDGNLIIEARKNDMGQDWTSVRLTTRGKVSFRYGKIEFRAKVPVADGTWAAGWLLGDAYRDEISWPYCGEIDVLECVGREIDDQTGDGINHASCHTRAYYFKQGNHISNTIPVKNMNEEYHTYTVEWYPNGVYAFLDGKMYYTYDKLDGEWEWPFNNPQNIIINLAMGGGMGGWINPEITSPKFIIDYVRVYELQ